MAIIFCKNISDKSIVSLWKIEETSAYYLKYLGIAEENLLKVSGVTHPMKQLEWLASRTCAKYTLQQLGLTFHGIGKDEQKNPYLHQHEAFISLSHTNEYAAVIVNLSNDVGCDIEKISDKLLRVAHKYLSEPELQFAQNDLLKLCILWCAKESLYKWYGKKNLSFKDNIYIEPFQEKPTTLKGEILIEGKTKTEHELFVFYKDDYVFTIT